MTEYNLTFLELMRVVKEGDRVECLFHPDTPDTVATYEVEINGRLESGVNGATLQVPWVYRYRILKPEPKLVKWHRPSVIWVKDREAPESFNDLQFMKSKDISQWDMYGDRDKVLEWETKEFPATWSECDGDT